MPVERIPHTVKVVLAALAVMTIGVAGYMIIEGYAFLDALYMVVITLATVGFEEVRPLSDAGRIFTIVMILGGVGGILYTSTTIIQTVVEGQFGRTLWRRRMQARVARLKDHFTVCGYGRLGRHLVEDLQHGGASVVVIDTDDETLTAAARDGFPYVKGNAAEDEVLKEAGIQRAQCLIAATGQDEDNIYIILSARALRPDLLIIARCNQDASESKLLRAGANEAISPYHIGGHRIATAALRPQVVDFFESVMPSEQGEVSVEMFRIDPSSPLVQQSLQGSGLREQFGVSVLAVVKPRGRLITNPGPETLLEEGDQLIVLGSPNQLQRLEGGGLAGRR